MDAAILLVAATDGLMPQTREHLSLSKQIGIKQIIVFINKVINLCLYSCILNYAQQICKLYLYTIIIWIS